MKTPVADSVLVVEDLADVLDLAMRHPNDDTVETVSRLIARHEHAQTAVRISEAADLLDVSVPTVRDWADRGCLDDVPDTRVRTVSAVSLGWAYALLRRSADNTEDTRTRLARILESLEDRALLIRGRELATDLREEDLVSFSREELAELRSE